MNNLIKVSEQIALFCRINVNTKRDLPIRSSEMGMLIYLVKTEEEKTPNGVAQFFRFTKAMATNMVTSLSSKGYITKKQSEIDKRSVYLVPTNKAIKLVENTYDEYFKSMSTLRKRMGEEKFENLVMLIEMANNILLEENKNG
ncbi:MarR family winged helix-turn-helix transcriptional regulator [Breznakia pachnodae]|uniref:HTH-type transcriptional regulator SarZ n=1 Tax=Breznakia pachnodae TaxID=265178 RepID=A0ABU0E5W9_9FIRM|nr:MarR family transcriptional regulator [Breznakia pachnodae]MDQ0362121.1 DNA-binding MarR family transcriptional regulator [Breznakia pachnodae]